MASLTATLPSFVFKGSLRGSNKPVEKPSSTALALQGFPSHLPKAHSTWLWEGHIRHGLLGFLTSVVMQCQNLRAAASSMMRGIYTSFPIHHCYPSVTKQMQ